MNNAFAMDREEKIGLGTALGGHALLLALLVFGLWKAVGPSGSDGGGSAEGDGVAVELVSESSAPAPVTAPEPVVEEVVETVQEQPEIIPDDVVAALPTPKPKQQPTPAPKQKPQAKPVPKQATKQPAAKTKTGGARSKDFERDMDRVLGGLGGGTGDTKKKGQGDGGGEGKTTKTAGQIRSQTSAAIASEVRPFIPGCAPSTSDNSSLIIYVQLSIGKNAGLIDADVYDVKGITPGNQAQVERMKSCVLSSLRAASPYNLDPLGFDTWKNHKVQLKVNFK